MLNLTLALTVLAINFVASFAAYYLVCKLDNPHRPLKRSDYVIVVKITFLNTVALAIGLLNYSLLMMWIGV